MLNKLFQICLFLGGHCHVSHGGQGDMAPFLRQAGIFVRGVVILLHRCPGVAHQGCTADGDEPEAHTKTF